MTFFDLRPTRVDGWPAVRLIGTIFVLSALMADTVAAQTTSAAPREQARQEQAQSDPQDSGKLEKLFRKFEKNPIYKRLSSGADGFYPRLGGLQTGAGFSAGVGYRNRFLDDHARFRASTAFSIRGYRLFQVEQTFEKLGKFGAFAGVVAAVRHSPQEDYYGLGPRSEEGARTSYLLDTNTLTATAGVNPIGWLRVGGRLGYMFPELGPGTDKNFPTTGALFNEELAPGLERQPDYLMSSVFITADTRDSEGNARSGSFVHLEYSLYSDRDFARYSFSRSDFDVAHFIPFFDKKHALALHGRLIVSDARPGHVVPFYLMPTVGGSDSVRSLAQLRFSDENALYMNAEYRWELLKALDVAVFGDAGKVSKEVGLERLRSAVGFGFRFNTDDDVFLRIDFAKGAEDTRLWFKLNPSF